MDHLYVLSVKRLAPCLLGFVGALLPLVCLDFLREALEDGLEGATLPVMSGLVMHLAPIGPVVYAVPILVAGGIGMRTSGFSTSNMFWAFLAAVLMFACVIGALLPFYERRINMDGGNHTLATGSQWAGNLLLIAAAGLFALGGVRGRAPKKQQPGPTEPAPRPLVEPEGGGNPQPGAEGRS